MTLTLERARELRFKACLLSECKLAGVPPEEVLSSSRRGPLVSVRKRIVKRLRKVQPREDQPGGSLFTYEWLAQRMGRDHTTIMHAEQATDKVSYLACVARRVELHGMGMSKRLISTVRAD
ncbi:MAG: hypothetical protein AAFR65_11130 [Pseudomonadota bacterium]